MKYSLEYFFKKREVLINNIKDLEMWVNCLKDNEGTNLAVEMFSSSLKANKILLKELNDKVVEVKE